MPSHYKRVDLREIDDYQKGKGFVPKHLKVGMKKPASKKKIGMKK